MNPGTISHVPRKNGRRPFSFPLKPKELLSEHTQPDDEKQSSLRTKPPPPTQPTPNSMQGPAAFTPNPHTPLRKDIYLFI